VCACVASWSPKVERKREARIRIICEGECQMYEDQEYLGLRVCSMDDGTRSIALEATEDEIHYDRQRHMVDLMYVREERDVLC